MTQMRWVIYQTKLLNQFTSDSNDMGNLSNKYWRTLTEKTFSVDKYRYSVRSLFLPKKTLRPMSQEAFFRKNLSRIAIVSSIALQGNHINNRVSNQYKYQFLTNHFQLEFYTTKGNKSIWLADWSQFLNISNKHKKTLLNTSIFFQAGILLDTNIRWTCVPVSFIIGWAHWNIHPINHITEPLTNTT